ncbi:MAG: c-type cytochrome domain-containing protein, partial [Planctomycetota bacterium]|nr:c-type cytochrome domain-containing protein [Planctomycetota bacterium]
MRFCPPIPAILTGLLATIASLASQKTTISFNRDVRPIFSEHCSSCHGPDAGARKAKLRLDTPAGALAALREGGHAIKPGKPEQSVLLHRIESNDPKFRMPPAESGPALTTAQIQTLSTWIAEGAKFEPHWSYIKTSRHPLPRTKNKNWPLNPIDHFILAEIERCELKTSP